MAKRFKQLIVGSGWEFFENLKGWDKEILSQERSNRVSIKNLIVSAISDIGKTYEFDKLRQEGDSSEGDHYDKYVQVHKFLNNYLELLFTDVPKNSHRFQ